MASPTRTETSHSGAETWQRLNLMEAELDRIQADLNDPLKVARHLVQLLAEGEAEQKRAERKSAK